MIGIEAWLDEQAPAGGQSNLNCRSMPSRRLSRPAGVHQVDLDEGLRASQDQTFLPGKEVRWR